MRLPSDFVTTNRSPTQTTSLGDDGANVNRSGQADTDQPTIENLLVENQPIHAGLVSTPSQSSNDFGSRVSLIDEAKDFLNGSREGIGEQENGRIPRPWRRPSGELELVLRG